MANNNGRYRGRPYLLDNTPVLRQYKLKGLGGSDAFGFWVAAYETPDEWIGRILGASTDIPTQRWERSKYEAMATAAFAVEEEPGVEDIDEPTQVSASESIADMMPDVAGPEEGAT